MTETTSTAPTSLTINTSSPEPDYLEDLLRARGLKALYWHVGDPARVDEEDPGTAVIAPLRVIFFNGRRYFSSEAILDIDVIYGLVGQDEISRETAEFATDQIVALATVADVDLESFEKSEEWATALSPWTHSDADLLRCAADRVEGEWGELLRVIADIVERIVPGTSFADPNVQLAAAAVRIAWDLL